MATRSEGPEPGAPHRDGDLAWLGLLLALLSAALVIAFIWWLVS